MKRINIILISWLFISIVSTAMNINAQDDDPLDTVNIGNVIESMFSELDQSKISTGILIDRTLALSDYDAFDGQVNNTSIDKLQWMQIYDDLRRASLNSTNFPSINQIMNQSPQNWNSSEVDICIIACDYNIIKENAYENGLILFQNDKFIDAPNSTESPYEVKQVIAACSNTDEIFKNQIKLRIPYSKIISNSFNQFSQIIVSVNGQQIASKIITQQDYTAQQTHSASNSQEQNQQAFLETSAFNLANGENTIIINLVHNGATKSCSFKLNVMASVPEPNDGFTIQGRNYFDPVTGVTKTGSCEASIFYGIGHTSIKNPLIFVEGIDPIDSYDYQKLYKKLNKNGLADQLRSNGFDLVIVSWGNDAESSFFLISDGGDYIQANAFAFQDLIVQINSMKTSLEDLTIIAASMGGIVARYALLEMEYRGVDHHVGKIITYDSPHQGANIPLGLQKFVDKIRSAPFATFKALPFDYFLSTPAAQQLLVYSYKNYNKSNKTAGPSLIRQQLLNEFELMGRYPTDTRLRKYAIANGSSVGIRQKNDDGDVMGSSSEILYINKKTAALDVKGRAYSLPIGNGTIGTICNLTFDWLGPQKHKHYKYEVSIPANGAIDNTPGGTSNTTKRVGDGISKKSTSIKFPVHCFIPTVSALDIRDLNDVPVNPTSKIADQTHIYTGPPADNTETVTTPFDDVYFGSANDEHVGSNSGIVSKLSEWLFTIPNTLLLQNQEINRKEGTYKAANNIIFAGNGTNFNIGNQGITEFKAGNEIVLKSGFKAMAGSDVLFKVNQITQPANISFVNYTQSIAKQGDNGQQQETHVDNLSKQQNNNEILTFSLSQNYPNPFNPTTTLKYTLKESSNVSLKIYNMLGQEVRSIFHNNKQSAGSKSVQWDGKNNHGDAVPSGMYIYRLQAGSFLQTRKMLLLK